eukprot:gene10674-7599_t
MQEIQWQQWEFQAQPLTCGAQPTKRPVKQKGVKSIYDCSTKNRDLTVDETVIMFMIPVSGQLNTEQQMVKPEAGGFLEEVE